jgi:hypothetical protein
VDQELFKAQHQPQQHGDVTEPWPIGRLRHPLSFKGTGTFISPLAAFYMIDDQVNAGETARIKVERQLVFTPSALMSVRHCCRCSRV